MTQRREYAYDGFGTADTREGCTIQSSVGDYSVYSIMGNRQSIEPNQGGQ